MTDKQIRPPYEIALMHDHILRLEEELKAKKQECEELKKIIDEAKNSKLDLKSFLVGEAVQNEYEQQLDQLKAENEHLSEKEEEARHYLEEAYKYKQTLTEIKEFAKKEIVCDDCNFQGTDKCDSRLCTSFYLDDFCKSLLQKISEYEVIDVENN